MPPSRFLLLGIALLLCAACAGGPASAPASASTATPTPIAFPTSAPGGTNAPWALDLDLTGDLAAHVTGTAPSDETIHNDCTGTDSTSLGSWASTMAFTSGPARYALYILVKDYRGASTFSSGVSVEVSSEDQQHVWQNESGDAVTLTVGAGQVSGLLQAVLSNVADTTKKLTISGHWSCHP
jgi:hypothetical protein